MEEQAPPSAAGMKQAIAAIAEGEPEHWEPPTIGQLQDAINKAERLAEWQDVLSPEFQLAAVAAEAQAATAHALQQIIGILKPTADELVLQARIPEEVQIALEQMANIIGSTEVATYTTIRGAGSDPAEISPRVIAQQAVMQADAWRALEAAFAVFADWIGGQQ